MGGDEKERCETLPDTENITTMSKEKFYPEETLIEKIQSGEYGWHDYVTHTSREWKQEYEKYCRLRELPMNDENAWKFIEMKQAEMEEAIAGGNL